MDQRTNAIQKQTFITVSTMLKYLLRFGYRAFPLTLFLLLESIAADLAFSKTVEKAEDAVLPKSGGPPAVCCTDAEGKGGGSGCPNPPVG